jgi:uncharacterized pyridoxal phosphate-containing UPF0001 family protein
MQGPGFDPAEERSRASIEERLAGIWERIGRYRDPQEVSITAVTKGFDSSVLDELVACGLCHVGENYVQELRAKQPLAPSGITWRFIGGIQRNKLSWLARNTQVIESISNVAELERLKAGEFVGELFVQMRSDDSPQRHGAEEAEIASLVERARELGLNIVGLMGVAPVSTDLAAVDFFRRVRGLADRCGLAMCSMGMSGDYEYAVAEGATHLRLGRALLGERRRA